MPDKGEPMRIGIDIGPVWLIPLGMVAFGTMLGLLLAEAF